MCRGMSGEQRAGPHAGPAAFGSRAGTPPNSCPAPARVYSTDETAVGDAQISLKSQNNPTEMRARCCLMKPVGESLFQLKVAEPDKPIWISLPI